MPIKTSRAKIARRVLYIEIKLSLTLSGNLPSSGLIPSGFTKALEIGSKTRAPRPKPPIVIPEIRPFLLGNHNQD